MPGVVIASPFPFPDHEATTNVVVYQEQDTEDQGPISTVLYDGPAIYDEKAKIVYNKDSKQISLSGMLIIHGDVQALEGKTAFQGFVLIGEEKKQIYTVRKPKLLGVIYSTEIDLL
ncbi:hypothetical protein HMPREF0863_01638 [Erysipelotrichaceae bacterium 5_2_54FAA]|nr:hypothetical protein HMPREF0863_01638 [Erysipelotrichaceae bacterium 5_2_54FAA]